MRLFEIQPGDTGETVSIWHLDLDHVVSMRDKRASDGSIYWLVELSNNQNINPTKACFERMMQAWESK